MKLSVVIPCYNESATLADLHEVGISYHGWTHAEGKKIDRRNGFQALYAICKYNLR